MIRLPDPQVDLAARAIVDLINSRPTSPSQHEIATIIQTTMAASPGRASGPPDLADCKALDREYGPIISTIRN
jgi:hypothetical protein